MTLIRSKHSRQTVKSIKNEQMLNNLGGSL